jgi:very-short-patch-repair endonuclease
MPDDFFSLDCSVADHVNIAFLQNAIPVINDIKLTNEAENDISDIVIEVVTDPPFTAPLTIPIDLISAGGARLIQAPNLRLDGAYLRSLSEGLAADFVITIRYTGAKASVTRFPTRLQPPSHWGGSGAAPELVAAFVRPNDPAIDVLLHEASRRLAATGKRDAIDGYQTGGRDRAWDLASAIWSALAARGITYSLPPASFERLGQKVRSPSDILDRKTGTCFDLSLLYAALLEQAGLNPVVVLTHDHAFVGLWLKKEEFSSAVVDDMQFLRKRRDLEDMIFIETTALATSIPARFREAVKLAGRHVDENSPQSLEIAVDVHRARAMEIRPLDLGERGDATAMAAHDATPFELEMDAAPVFADEVAAKDVAEEPADRMERWKRKLLDLSLRNKLLNFKEGNKSVALECPDPARLEDVLAAGEKFRLMARSDVLAEGGPRDAELYREMSHIDGRSAFLNAALGAKEVYTCVSEKELDNRLTELYRMTRTAFEEGGANILFLAFGFLKWSRKDGGAPYLAPLILVPVALERSSVRAGYRLKMHEDEARFNPTLLEMLRQDFEFKIPELEKDLPTDVSGIDVARIWQIVRTQINSLRGWEVTGSVVLSTFSFTKFLMWRDLVDRADVLKQNPIVRHLIDTPKESYGEGPETFPHPARIDSDYHPRDLFAPLSADSSQLAAVLAAASGKDFVLFGPPGTGKSQTIANMISQCLALGKTVLFVSQKTAALEVVQRRLKDIGLADFCLEVHSAKAQKSAVLTQLKTSWHERAQGSVEDWEGATSDLATLRDELNGLVRALHTRHSNGLSAYQAFGWVIAYRDQFQNLNLSWTTDPDEAELKRLRELCREVTLILGDLGDPTAHSLNGVFQSQWSHGWRSELEAALDETVLALRAIEPAAKAFASSLGIEFKNSWAVMRGLLYLCNVIGRPEGRLGADLIGIDILSLRDVVGELEGHQKKLQDLTAMLSTGFRPAVFQHDLRTLLGDWTEACNANFLFRSGKQRKVRQSLQNYATGPLPDDIGQDVVILIELTGVVEKVQGLGVNLAAFGASWTGVETDADQLKHRLDWVEGTRTAASSLAQVFGVEAASLLELIKRLETSDRFRLANDGDVRLAQRAYVAAWGVLQLPLNRVAQLTKGFPEKSAPYSAVGWVATTIELFQRWRAGLHDAHRWCRWQEVSNQASVAGLDTIVQAVSRGAVAPAMIVKAFEVAHARWWAGRIVDRDPVLRSFLAVQQEDAIKRFRAADERIAELSKLIIRSKLVGTVPAPNAFGKDVEWGALSRELVKKQRHMPLRQLFASIPNVLTRLTPCVMMSPLSIAQYLPADGRNFDVVIFDEASQIPVWDAIGAMARGKQVVIAGDPEQLPPTNVGERGVDEVDDGIDVEDQESILSECIASNIPPRRLDWHYRSRHESLITFSNWNYYDGRLVTFPSPVTDDRAVRYVNVPNGIYERGAGRVNREEARVVVAELVRRLKAPEFASKRDSIGIVTFNGEQQRLIENLLDAERRQDASIERFFDPLDWHEPVFVKNLENVQGDERETILFSVAVAPDASGRGVSTISSLNKDGGYRRLNVAITRARREMIVFATLRPDQIDLGRTRARGVRDFKHFLEFAERGPRALNQISAPTGEEPESPFETAVLKALELRGWKLHAQVGVSGFRIDLGVVHPEASGRYLAGIECDGATYHRSATARDRDRLRENVLRGLGWTIHRVWSTDWWHDADRALDRLDNELLADLAKETRSEAEQNVQMDDEAAVEAPLEMAASEPDVGRGEVRSDNTVIAAVEKLLGAPPLNDVPGLIAVPAPEPVRVYAGSIPIEPMTELTQSHAIYVVADPAASGIEPDQKLFYEPQHRPRICAMVSHVIEIEGPIYEDLLVLRIARAHAFARAAGRIRDVVVGSIDAGYPRTTDDGRVLIWPKAVNTEAPLAFRSAPNHVRDHTDIPLVELKALGRLFQSRGADNEETVRRMAAQFGLGKLREATRRRFEAAIAE